MSYCVIDSGRTRGQLDEDDRLVFYNEMGSLGTAPRSAEEVCSPNSQAGSPIRDWISGSDYLLGSDPQTRLRNIERLSEMRATPALLLLAQRAEESRRREFLTPSMGSNRCDRQPVNGGGLTPLECQMRGDSVSGYSDIRALSPILDPWQPSRMTEPSRAGLQPRILGQLVRDPANVDNTLATVPEASRFRYLFWAAQTNYNVLRFTRAPSANAIWEHLLASLDNPPTEYRHVRNLVVALTRVTDTERPHRFYTVRSALTLIHNGHFDASNITLPGHSVMIGSPEEIAERVRPLLLVFGSLDDINRGLEDGIFSQVIDAYSETHRVFYIETGNEAEVQNALNLVRRVHPHPLNYAVHIMHGRRNLMELTSRTDVALRDETEYIDEADMEDSSVRYTGAVAGATFLSCYTGLSLVRTAARQNHGVEFSGPDRVTRHSTFGYTPEGLPLIGYEPGVRRIRVLVE